MPLDRRSLRPGESPFKFRNPDSARSREELVNQTKGKYNELQDFLNQRTQRLRRKGDN
jgi:hypothetical protein